MMKPQTEESDDAAFVERMLPKAHRDDGQMLGMCISDDDIVRLIALARRATTKSETDGAVTDAAVNALQAELGRRYALTPSAGACADILRAALARTPAADNDGAAMRAENAKLRKALESTERALSFWKEQAK